MFPWISKYSNQFWEYLYLLFALINSGNIFIYFLSLHQSTFKSYQTHFMRYYSFRFYSQTIKRRSILLKWYFQLIENGSFLFEVLTSAKSILIQLNNSAFVFTRSHQNEVPVSFAKSLYSFSSSYWNYTLITLKVNGNAQF